MSDPLATYLHDHLGGARAAIELLAAMRDQQKDKALGDFAAHLLAEVEADRLRPRKRGKATVRRPRASAKRQQTAAA